MHSTASEDSGARAARTSWVAGAYGLQGPLGLSPSYCITHAPHFHPGKGKTIRGLACWPRTEARWQEDSRDTHSQPPHPSHSDTHPFKPWSLPRHGPRPPRPGWPWLAWREFWAGLGGEAHPGEGPGSWGGEVGTHIFLGNQGKRRLWRLAASPGDSLSPGLLLPALRHAPTAYSSRSLGAGGTSPGHLPGGGCVYAHCADEDTKSGSHRVTQHIQLDPAQLGCGREGRGPGN